VPLCNTWGSGSLIKETIELLAMSMSDMSTPMLENSQHANAMAKRLPFAFLERGAGGSLS
jgi:hypothetical protein